MNIPKKKLEQVRAQLKSEFDGIDEIIDKVINIMASWNNNVVRPIVIPIFGMTGVGKTSMINRLIELLGLKDRATNIPLGVSTKGDSNTRPAKLLLDSLGFSDYDNYMSITDVKPDSILIFDEIQKLNSVDEDGNEQETECDELWSLLDNGKVNYVSTNSSEKARFEKWIMILTRYLLKDYGDAIVENALTTDPRVIKELMDLKMVYDSRKDLIRRNDEDEREFKSIQELKDSLYQDSDKAFTKILDINFEIVPNEDEDDEETLTLSMAPFRVREDLRNTLQELSTVDEVKDFLNAIMRKQTLKEYCETLTNIMKFINEPHYIDFHQSVIFLIGNLDEAFKVSRDLDPDIDADVFHQLTKEVNINDIKTALLRRFRPEQIARFGNNYVIYPSFSKDTFKKIIKRYLENDMNAYKNNSGIELTYSPEILDLIYSESVFPTQGTRPVLSTVSAFGFIFNEIDAIVSESKKKITEFQLYLEDGNKSNFKTDRINLILQYVNDEEQVVKKTIPYDLYLGKLRNPKNDDSRFLKSVHELGHAFMMALETGKLPSSIITTSSANSGGFCMRNIEEIRKKKITNIDTMKSDIRISLGGWVAERIVFPEHMCSLGSSSDIANIWDEISYAYFSDGYVAPVAFGKGEKPDGVPHGIDDPEIMDKIQESLMDLKKEVEEKITKYSPLIADLSMTLAEKGSFTETELMDELLIRKGFVVDDAENCLVQEFYKEIENKERPKSDNYHDVVLSKRHAKEKDEEPKQNWFVRILKRIIKKLEDHCE